MNNERNDLTKEEQQCLKSLSGGFQKIYNASYRSLNQMLASFDFSSEFVKAAKLSLALTTACNKFVETTELLAITPNNNDKAQQIYDELYNSARNQYSITITIDNQSEVLDLLNTDTTDYLWQYLAAYKLAAFNELIEEFNNRRWTEVEILNIIS